MKSLEQMYREKYDGITETEAKNVLETMEKYAPIMDKIQQDYKKLNPTRVKK